MVEVVVVQGGIPPETYEEAVNAGRQAILEYISESGGQRPRKVSVKLGEDGDWECELDVPKPVIARKRRITGYLSDYTNFNSSKRAEAKDRVKHLRLAQ